MYEDKYTVNEDKARMIYDWLCWRGGILIWVSADLSDPSYSVTTPYLDEKGNQKSKPSWKLDDIPTFSIKRLAYGIRWWEDVLGNGNAVLYSQEILDKYKNTWE